MYNLHFYLVSAANKRVGRSGGGFYGKAAHKVTTSLPGVTALCCCYCCSGASAAPLAVCAAAAAAAFAASAAVAAAALFWLRLVTLTALQ